ncbi:MAG: MBL fold metallo-hydrolase [Candidatus Calescibacterium sp.]|nr:MBL fold metallo-hydrolase [Candidatus Calescibacterium sp.]MDW8132546.1 MBL fold metallo-hydrolase [Candidatus Calescibacterium sp.]
MKRSLIKIVIIVFFFLFFVYNFVLADSIKYLGHSCFLIEVDSKKILIDPYSYDMGYPLLSKINLKEVNLILSTHEHFDHFNKDVFKISQKLSIPYFVGTKDDGQNWNPINYKFDKIYVNSINTYHDSSLGNDRGKNSVIVIKTNKFKIAHLGDLGHILDKKQAESLKSVDFLFVPVGGFFTISSAEAVKIIKTLSPKVVIPMHYKTKYTRDFPISDINEFIKLSEKELKDYVLVKKEYSDMIIKVDNIKNKSIFCFIMN